MTEKTVFISGSTGTLGRALARELARQNCALALFCHANRPAAEELAALCLSSGSPRVKTYAADLRNRAQLNAAFEQAAKDFPGEVDALINCAGTAASAPVAKMTPESWQQTLDVNLTGARNLFLAAFPLLKQRGGHLLQIGSLRGLAGSFGGAAYAASKAALVGLCLSAAREWADQNIRVNLVFPGLMRSALTDSALGDFSAAAAQNILGRPNTIEEIASLTARLALSQNISGQVFNLDSRPLKLF